MNKRLFFPPLLPGEKAVFCPNGLCHATFETTNAFSGECLGWALALLDVLCRECGHLLQQEAQHCLKNCLMHIACKCKHVTLVGGML